MQNCNHNYYQLSLYNDKYIDWSKLKAFADDKINVPQNLTFLGGRIENVVGKEENTGYQHFLLFLQCFSRSLKVLIVWERVKTKYYRS